MQTIKLDKPVFTNLYCDGISCALSEFVTVPKDFDACKNLSPDDCQTLVEYAAMKNKVAGVGHLYIKVPNYGIGKKALEKFVMTGCEIIDAHQIQNLPTSAMIGESTIVEIADLLDFQQNALSDIADTVARAELPLMIDFGSDLEKVGRLVNLYKMSPAQVLESFGFLDRKCFLRGLNFIDKDDQKLIREYAATCIFTPSDDGMYGRGAINLYSFACNKLKFGFGSGTHYNIDMLAECQLSLYNTANLMFEPNLLAPKDLLAAISNGVAPADIAEKLGSQPCASELHMFDKRVELSQFYQSDLREKAQEISYKLKEKI